MPCKIWTNASPETFYDLTPPVTVCKLVKTPELNGQRGQLQGYDEAKGRYRVKLLETGGIALLKPANFIRKRVLPVYEDVKHGAARIQIGAEPFAEGQLRFAYQAMLQFGKGSQSMIVKEFKDSASKAEYGAQLEENTIAAFFATKWNKLFPGKCHIEYARSKLVRVHGGGAERWLNMEPVLDGEYQKYMNNVGLMTTYAQPDVLEFAKWTHDVSQGQFMVVDLQGVRRALGGGRNSYMLTDPVIVCLDKSRFGKGNHVCGGKYSGIGGQMRKNLDGIEHFKLGKRAGLKSYVPTSFSS